MNNPHLTSSWSASANEVIPLSPNIFLPASFKAFKSK